MESSIERTRVRRNGQVAKFQRIGVEMGAKPRGKNGLCFGEKAPPSPRDGDEGVRRGKGIGRRLCVSAEDEMSVSVTTPVTGHPSFSSGKNVGLEGSSEVLETPRRGWKRQPIREMLCREDPPGPRRGWQQHICNWGI